MKKWKISEKYLTVTKPFETFGKIKTSSKMMNPLLTLGQVNINKQITNNKYNSPLEIRFEINYSNVSMK